MAITSFIPPIPLEIHDLTRGGNIPTRFLDLLESIPASYLVIHNSFITPARRPQFEFFLARAVESGRLRFVRSYGERDDLYAVTKTEPEARQEAPLPFSLTFRDWQTLLREDPVHLVGDYHSWSETLYRLHKAAYGRAPRMADLLADAETLGRGIVPGLDAQEAKLESNLAQLVEERSKSEPFARLYQKMSDEQYLEAIYANAGWTLPAPERDSLAASLRDGTQTRAQVLRKLLDNPEFIRREHARAFVLLHYFGYLRRDPGDPPDKGMEGYDFWVRETEASGDTSRLTRAFMESGEYKALDERRSSESNEQR